MKKNSVENRFILALEEGNILLFFQPIVDKNMKIQGFEILIRWLNHGTILFPGQFLKQIKTSETWFKLTEFVSHNAVRLIKQFSGRFYFSINLPESFIASDKCFYMLNQRQEELSTHGWSDKLILEVNEETEMHNNNILNNLLILQKNGTPVILDDCFSQSSVLFPVRRIHFSGYKLDMTIVDDLMDDEHSCNLIKSLVYYCQLTGCQCIAEGVDSKEKMDKLLSVNVNQFQGYYISPAVPESCLGKIIMEFS